MFKYLDFKPLPGFTSPHAQMVFSNYGPVGNEPHSEKILFHLRDGDRLSCHVSTPVSWKTHQPTIALVHGLGGSHESKYMIRLSRKFYQLGKRVLRINLRGCGTGKGLNRLPYNSGNSHDVWDVVKNLKSEHPFSPITLIGFSLGGNVILKMAGEYGLEAANTIQRVISICPPLDIKHSISLIGKRRHWLYHKYYLKWIYAQGQTWIKDHKIRSIWEYDEKVTAPLWGYLNAFDYYDKCSSKNFIPNIHLPCDILLAEDDPFIDPNVLRSVKIPPHINLWMTKVGGHMGYIGWAGKEHGVYCLDKLVMEKIYKVR